MADGPQTVEKRVPAGPPQDGLAPSSNGGPPTDEPATPAAPKKARPWLKPLIFIITLIMLAVGVSYGLRAYRYSQTHTSTDDAYLTSDVVPITPQVAGQVQRVLVSENQLVKVGQLLVVLDDSTYRADVEQARANRAVAEATARGAGTSVSLTRQTGTAQIEQAQGGVAQAQSGIAGAEADVARAEAGVANSRAAAQGARANVQTAQAAVTAAIAARQRAVEAVTSARAQVATARAALRAAQAGVTAAQANAEKANRDQARYAALFKQEAVSAQQLDVATAAATAAQAQVETAQQQVAQAQETITARQADLTSAQQQVQWSDAAIAQTRAQLAAAQDAARASEATIRSSQAQVLATRQGVAQARAKREQALGQLNQARTAPTQVNVSQASQNTAQARILQAQAALDTALIALRRTRIYAPVAGRVSKKTVEQGQQVAVGQTLMSIVPNSEVWVEANFKETQIRDVHPGQRAEIQVDTFPGRVFKGHVDSIAPGTGATFSLLPPDNATGNFTKVVQRVAVKIVFDPDQPDLDRLRAGLSVNATVVLR